MKSRSLIFDIEATGKDKEKLQVLKNDFNELSKTEKFDVLEFQNIMMSSLSKFNELSGIENDGEKDVSAIISRMSSRSLDHSQRCISYLKSCVGVEKDK